MWKWVEELIAHRETIRLQKMQHELDLRHCNACEVMQVELQKAHQRELELLKLIEKPEQGLESEVRIERHLPLTAKIPWNVKRQQLEKAARKNGHKKDHKEITADDLDDELEEVRGK